MVGETLKERGRQREQWGEFRPAFVLVLILLFALSLGVIKLWLDPPNWEANWENRWWQIALNVAHGEGYVACKPIYFPFCGETNQVTAMREPLPVLLFALVARLTGDSLLAAAALGVVINLLVAIAVFQMALELSDRLTGIVAALLWACYLAPVRLYYSLISGDLLASLFIACALLYLLRARRHNRDQDWLIAGFCIGLAMLSRSAALVIGLALGAGVLLWPFDHASALTLKRVRGPALRGVALFVLSWILTLSPWLVRNYLVFQQPVVGSTLAGYYLYRQHYQLPAENYLRFISGGEFVPIIDQMITRRSDLRGDENEAEMNQVYQEEALQIIRAHPLRYLHLSAYRFLMLWFNWGVKEVYGESNSLVDRIIIVQHALFLLTGLLGIAGRWRRAWPLAVSVCAFSILYMGVMAHLPYIPPVVPLLVVLSAMACVQMARRLLPRPLRGPLLGIIR